MDSHGNLFVSSRQTVRLVPAGDDGVVTGNDPVLTVYGAAPRSTFPDSVTACLTGLAVTPGVDGLLVLDACQGFLVRLDRAALPLTVP